MSSQLVNVNKKNNFKLKGPIVQNKLHSFHRYSKDKYYFILELAVNTIGQLLVNQILIRVGQYSKLDTGS